MAPKPRVIIAKRHPFEAVLPSACHAWSICVNSKCRGNGTYSNDIRTAILKPSTLDMRLYRQRDADPAFLLTRRDDAHNILIAHIIHNSFMFKKTHCK